jgi:hypothetical protein
METFDLKRAFSSPELVFGHPQRVVAAKALSHNDKVFVLRRWKQALERLWSPNASGGARAKVAPDVSAKLAAISNALNELGHR